MDKYIKKPSLNKRVEIVLTPNQNKTKNLSNFIIRTNLASKNEEINIGDVKLSAGKLKYEESKKTTLPNKRESSQSNSSNRILNTFKKENNYINLNKFVKTNMKMSQNPVVKKKDSDKNHLANSNSNSSNNLLTSNNSHNYKLPENENPLQNSIEIQPQIVKNVINFTQNQNPIQLNLPSKDLENETVKKSGVIQLNLRESSSDKAKKEEILKKENTNFNSIYPSNFNSNTLLQNKSSDKKDMNFEKQKTLYEKEIAALKGVRNS
jgi:hypothetical protein